VYPKELLIFDFLTPKTIELINKYDTLTPKPQEPEETHEIVYAYCDFDQVYKDQKGIEVKVSLTVTEKVGSFVYTIDYTLKNTTPGKELEEQSFKLYFSDGTVLNQYGGLVHYFLTIL